MTSTSKEEYRAIRDRVICYLTDDDPKHQATYPRIKRALIFSDGLSSPHMDITGIKGSHVDNSQERRMIDLAEYRQADKIVTNCINAVSGQGPKILKGIANYETQEKIRQRLYITSNGYWYKHLDQACYQFADTLDMATAIYGVDPSIIPPMLASSKSA